MASTTLKKDTQGYGYKYTDLSGVHTWLEQNNLRYYQYIETAEDGSDYIMTVPIVDGKEQPPRRGCKVVMATLSGKTNPAQEQGSALTYARRYSLLMAFGLATDDDDAACMTQPKTEAKTIFQEKKEAAEKTKISEAEYNRLLKQCDESGINPAIVMEKCHVEDLHNLTKKQFAWICGNWSKEFAVSGN